MHRRLVYSIIRYLISLIVFLALGVGIFVWWAVGQQLPERSQLELPKNTADLVAPEAPEFLTVVSYNIGHGQGVKEHAWDYRDKKTTENQLNLLGDAIKAMNADLILLQEVDIDSKRTFNINQIDLLQQRTGFAYQACANMWEKNYVPFPYWPPEEHLGYVRAANCVLSRFPLSNLHRVILPKPKSNAFLYNLGYIDRGIERVDILVGEQKIAVLNLHLEAWDITSREEQIKIVKNYMDEIDLPVILGGDFNTLMPDASIKTGFVDEPEMDFTKENSLAWLFANTNNLIASSITGHINNSPETVVNNNSDSAITNPFELYTFPSNQPTRRLDHIFLRGDKLSFREFRVVKEAGLASDHLPVMAKINYR